MTPKHLYSCPFYLLIAVMALVVGCQKPEDYRKSADKSAYDIIKEKREQATGQTSNIPITRPADQLRRKILESQGIATSGPASYGSDKLVRPEFWPDDQYNAYQDDPNNPKVVIDPNTPIKLDMLTALQVAAYNSPVYQRYKEEVFQSALSLDLARDVYRNTFTGILSGSIDTTTGDDTITSTSENATGTMKRTLTTGAVLSQKIAINLTSLLTQGRSSTWGFSYDPSITIPLLRGAGKHIFAEPLTQAERNLIYALQNFETNKKIFCIQITNNYLTVLQQLDAIRNAENNYRSSIISARRSRRLADAGNLPEIQVDQAVQSELDSRTRWISSQSSYESTLDNFKKLIGLPPDARLELDRTDLENLNQPAIALLDKLKNEYVSKPLSDGKMEEGFPAADDPVVLAGPNRDNAGPYEIDEDKAIRIALENRLDLRIAHGRVYDAQRDVIIKADALRAGLNLGGSASYRGSASSNFDNFNMDPRDGQYQALLSMDLPIERTAQRNQYRASLISMESAVRSVQTLEDDIKIAIRSGLRNLMNSRENLQISAQSVLLAEKRVKSTDLFLQFGKAQVRDLLDAQNALVAARDSLTRAVITYRIAELELQRNMDVLTVKDNGLWTEYTPQATAATGSTAPDNANPSTSTNTTNS